MEIKKIPRINCLRCVHFAVTWDPQFPKMCKLYGFKTASLPSLVVYRSADTECLGYVQKENNTNPR